MIRGSWFESLSTNYEPLFHFAVQRVLPVVTAELLQLELFCRRFPVLGRRVIPTLTLGALERDDLSSLSRHVLSF